MITASAKKRENIAEYLLYMWQIEDIIRAYGLDLDLIEKNIIDAHSSLTPEQKKEMRDWYESLIDMMRREGVEKSGHLQLNKNVLIDLNNLHARLLKNPKFARYAAEFYNTLPYIVEIRSKAGENKKDELESCFDALYGILMLRLQGKEISKETLEASQQISRFLALLAKYYRQDYNNELNFDDDEVQL
ncbi:MAG: DUF4924 family protein [Muribaculaceae bacterium]|nr:DUF4924 family protein [Muribaculaceae bacterium]